MKAAIQRPLLLLDVDGVLNPLSAPRRGGFRRYELLGFDVRLSRAHGRRLNALDEWFEIVWATTWQHDAPRLIAPRIGLRGTHDVIEFGEVSLDVDTWKLRDVARFVGDGPCAWIDDDLGADAYWWADAREAPTLLIRPDPRVGVTDDDFQTLEAFGRKVASGA